MVRLLAATLLLNGAADAATPQFSTAGAPSDVPVSFSMVSRVYVPYGNGDDDYAFGMGAVEKSAYDHEQKYLYAVSEQGYVNIVDFNDPTSPQVAGDWALDLQGETLTDVAVCSSQQLLFVASAASDVVSAGKVTVFSTAQRSSAQGPALVREIQTGPLPDMISPNNDCTILAVACEGEGAIIDGALVDPEGSLTLVRNPGSADFEAFSVALTGLGTDEELIAMGVHVPLPLKAMEYWDDHSGIAADLNFANVRENYNPAVNLEPEYLGWSFDGSKVYINLQENSALVTVTVPSGAWASQADFTVRIDAMGLKDWSEGGTTAGIDLIKDDGCTLKRFPGWKTLQQPDSIAVVNIDGVDHVLTANEGDDKEYGDYEEKQKLKDVIADDGTIQFQGMTLSETASTQFSEQNALGADSKRRVTIGSAAIDYSNPEAPVFQNFVGFGGRGVSIFRDSNDQMELVWDSGSELEVQGCANFAWAHNGIQDEEFAPVGGTLYNAASAGMRETIDEMNDPVEGDGCSDSGNGQPGACPLGQMTDDRSPKDGAGTEAMAVGVACGRLMAVTATEKSGIAFVYDITDVTAPNLLFVNHWSPISETKSPGVAYETRELGEIDSESILFVEAAHSPSGKAGVLVAGAWSGTVSFWEFGCPGDNSEAGSDGDAGSGGGDAGSSGGDDATGAEGGSSGNGDGDSSGDSSGTPAYSMFAAFLVAIFAISH